MIVQNTAGMFATNGKFPFKFEDLKSWTVRRTDGTITKYVLTSAPVAGGSTSASSAGSSSTAAAKTTSSLGDYCTHKPGTTPTVTFERDGSPIRMWIGNMSGAKATRDTFHYIVDCGDIFSSWNIPDKILTGDKELAEDLLQYTESPEVTRILKIDWDDRQAPKVLPEFWNQLNDRIVGDIMTCCVGGHGRSGTSFACLLLVNAPDYDALDAIVHIRAVHCPRAIESIVQHEYIDKVAEYLGRKGNSKEASTIKDYKALFMASKKPTAVRTQKELGWKK